MAGSERRPRVCVVGSGWRFTGGLSHYTCRLAARSPNTPRSQPC